MSREKRLKSIDDLDALRIKLCSHAQESKNKKKVRVCCGTGCQASGALKVVDALEKEREKQGVDFEIIKTGCQGFCEKGPLAIDEPENIFYQKLTPQDSERILSSNAYTGHLLYTDQETKQPIYAIEEIPFYKKQKKIVLYNNGRIDPCSVEQYITLGGYVALQKILKSIDQVRVKE